MSAFLAIVQDTWRQSKQQIVFIVMLVLLLVLALALIIIPKVHPESVRVFTESGSKPGAELRFEATQAVALSDLDGDGDLDAVCGNGKGHADRVWLNDGKASFSDGATLGEADTRAVVLGDLDGDGDADVVTGGLGPDSVWFNDGKAKFTAGGTVGDGTTAALALGDLDGDKDLDLVVGHSEGVTVWRNDGKGAFTKAGAVTQGDARAAGLFDLDGDGDLDLVVGRAAKLGNGVWLNDGKGGFSAGPVLGKTDARALVVTDLDLDGDPDVVIGSAGGERQQLWLNQGDKGWKESNRYAFGYGRGGAGLLALAVGDLNGDQKPDIVGGAAAGQENPVRLNSSAQATKKKNTKKKKKKRGNTLRQEPNFVPQAPVGGASELRALAVGDLDGDGHDEILAVFPQRDLGFRWADGPSEILGAYWIKLYGDTLIGTAEPEPAKEGETIPPEMARQAAAMAKAADLAQDIPGFQRSIEAWLVIGAKAIFTLSMILFIVACSAYFPSLLADGAVDVVLSRPVSRLHILAARFVGGLALFSAAILGTYLLVFLGTGMMTGVWHGRLFLAAPLQIFAAAVLYGILGCVGIVSRSTILAVILGLFFYIAVDSGLELLLQLETMGLLEEVPKLQAFSSGVRVTLPNFGMLKDVSTMSVLNVPSYDTQPLAVASAWLVICLGIGYWKFRRTDY